MPSYSNKNLFNNATNEESVENLEKILLWQDMRALPSIDSRFTAINSAGHSNVLTSVFQDINDSGNINWIMPASAETLSIVSDSIQDNIGIGGTGLHILALQGLDTNLNAIVDVVVLNGTTPVNSNLQFRSMHLAIAVAGGTPGSGAAGTITISGGGQNWGRLLEDATAAETSRIVVPTDYKYLVIGSYLTGAIGTDTTVRSEATLLGAFPISLAEVLVGPGPTFADNFAFIFFDAGTLVKFRGFTNSGNPASRKVTVTINLIGALVTDWEKIMNV
jgi:hypothetical protein